MSNTLLTPQVITNEALRIFKNNLPFASGTSHEYDSRFNKIGDTLKLRDQVDFIVNDGADITSQIQDVKETSKDLKIDTRKNVAFQFASQDLTLTVDRFAERYLNPAVVRLANKFESDGLTLAYQSSPNYVGTPGTTPSTALVYLNAGQVMDDNSCPVDDQRSVVINPKAQAATVDGLKGLLNGQTELSAQYRKGRMGTALGFDFAMSQNIRTHTNGTHGTTVQVDGASQSGSTLNVKGLTNTTGTVKKGTKFTIANVYAANRVSGDNLSDLRTFTVMADATADGSGKAALSIYPPMTATGASKTTSAVPADSANITFSGSVSTGYPANLAYHKDAFVYAMAELDMPNDVHFKARQTDKDTGLSIRLLSQYDIKTDIFVTRLDVLYGWAARRPEWSSVIWG